MANVKISQLPAYTGSASGSYLVMNDSTETTTYKITRENLLSGYTSSYSVSSSYALSSSYTISSSFASSSHLLDGYHSSVFARKNAFNTFTQDQHIILTTPSSSYEIGTYEGDTFFILDNTNGAEIGLSNKLSHFEPGHDDTAGIYVSSGSGLNYYTAIEIPNGPDFVAPNGLIKIQMPTQVTGSLTVSDGITGSLLATNGIISSSAQISQSGFVSSSTVQSIEVMTSASYSEITPVSGTLYVIIG